MKRLLEFFATTGGLGYAPVAPGTVASVAAAAIWFWWYPDTMTQWCAALLCSILGVWAAGRVVRGAADQDPSRVVIDEWAGMWLALAGLPRSLPIVVVALLLFRLLDIVKPPPIKQLERLPGGWGIMMDDVVAGLITRLVVAVGLVLLSKGVSG